MASTNHTTNYNLSQYVGTDKPTYLGDYNSDMGKIDTAIHNNATSISGVSGDLSTLSGHVGNISELETTIKTDVVSAINEVNGKATTNQTNIGSLSNLDTTNKTTIVNAINELYEEVNDETNHTITKVGNYVNIASQKVIERDHICYFHTQLNAQSNIPINTKIAEGFPKPEYTNYPVETQCVNNQVLRLVRITDNGDMYTTTSVNSGDILVVAGTFLIDRTTPQQ